MMMAEHMTWKWCQKAQKNWPKVVQTAAMDMEIVYLESVNAIPAMTANIAVKVSFEFLPGKQI